MRTRNLKVECLDERKFSREFTVYVEVLLILRPVEKLREASPLSAQRGGPSFWHTRFSAPIFANNESPTLL